MTPAASLLHRKQHSRLLLILREALFLADHEYQVSLDELCVGIRYQCLVTSCYGYRFERFFFRFALAEDIECLAYERSSFIQTER